MPPGQINNNGNPTQGAAGQPPAASGTPAQRSQTPPAQTTPEMCMDLTSGYYADYYRISSIPPAPLAQPPAFVPQAAAPIQLNVELWEGGSFPGELIPMIELGSTPVRRGQVLEVPPSGIEVAMPDGHRWRVSILRGFALVTDMNGSPTAGGQTFLRPGSSFDHVPFEMNSDGAIVFKPELEHLGRDVMQVRLGVGAGYSEINYLRTGSVIPVANRGMTEVTAFDGETIRYTKYNGNVYRLSPTGDLLTPFGTNVETISVGGRVAVRFSPAPPAPPPAPSVPSGPPPPSFEELFLEGEVRQVRMPAPVFDGESRTVFLNPAGGESVEVSPLNQGTMREEFSITVAGDKITVGINGSREFELSSGKKWSVAVSGGELVFTEMVGTVIVGTQRATPGSFFPLRGVGLERGITYTKDGRTNTLYVRQDANGRRELICRYNSGDNSRFVGYEGPAPQEFQFTKSCGQLGIIYRPEIPEPKPSWVFSHDGHEYRIGQTADGTFWQESSSGGTDHSLRQCQEGERFGPYAVKNGDLVLVDQPPQIVSDIRTPAASTRYVRAQETYINRIEPGQQVEIMAGEESYIISRSQESVELEAQLGSAGPIERTTLTSNDRIVIRRAGQPLEAAVSLENFSGESFQVRRASPGVVEISLRPQPVANYSGLPPDTLEKVARFVGDLLGIGGTSVPSSGNAGARAASLQITSGGTVLVTDLPPLSPVVDVLGQTWTVRPEFHLTLLGFGRVSEITKQLKATGLSNNQSREALKAAVEEASQGLTFEVSLQNEWRIAQHNGNRSLIAMADCPQMEPFFQRLAGILQARHGIQINAQPPPAHVTLYTGENGQAIGIVTEQELAARSRPLNQSELMPLETLRNTLCSTAQSPARGSVPAGRQAVEPSTSAPSFADPSSDGTSRTSSSTPSRTPGSGRGPNNRSTEIPADDFFRLQSAGSTERATPAPAARAAAEPSAAVQTAQSSVVGGVLGFITSFINNGIEYLVGSDAAPYVEAPVDTAAVSGLLLASGTTLAQVAAGGPVIAPLAGPAAGVARSVTEAVGVNPNSPEGRVVEGGITGTILGFAARYLAPAFQAAETAASRMFWPLFVVNVAATAVQHPEETAEVVETMAEGANYVFNGVVGGILGEGAVQASNDFATSSWNPVYGLIQDVQTGWDLLGQGGQLVFDGVAAVGSGIAGGVEDLGDTIGDVYDLVTASDSPPISDAAMEMLIEEGLI